jgi:hypothetical protein
MKIAIVGAGGFAREVAWLISDIERHGSQGETSTPLEFVGYLVSDASKIGERDSEVLGDFSWLKKNRVDALAMGIGNPAVRLKLGNELREKFPDIKWPALIHPSVKYGPECVFGAGVNICAGTIATVNITFGNFCMVNLSCTIGHETVYWSEPMRRSSNTSQSATMPLWVLEQWCIKTLPPQPR